MSLTIKEKNAVRNGDEKSIDIFMFVLIAMQPLLDVFSYFMIEIGHTEISTMIRMLLFVLVVFYGFVKSDNKKIYYIATAIMATFWLLHMIVCFKEGYQSFLKDASTYTRTVQLPYFFIVFVTMFKKGLNVDKAIRNAFVSNYFIISAVIILSFLVGKPVYTYETNIGIKGWFAIGNAQSAIVAILAPLTVYWAIKNKNKIISFVVVAVAYTNLYMFGTRVTYYFIFISLIGIIGFMFINKCKDFAMYACLILCIVICGAGYKYSPCYMNTHYMQEAFTEWNDAIENIKNEVEDSSINTDINESKEYYEEIYSLYTGKLVERFGLEKVVEKYDYSKDANDLMDNRKYKVNFGRLVMDEKGIMPHLFGFEYADYLFHGESYEPENDFPAIYFSNGIIGFAMYVAFLLYFVIIIILKVKREGIKALTVEAGVIGITFVMFLGTAQFSGNVLRRPNVTIYFSIILAYIYYICRIKNRKSNVDMNT